MFVLDTSSYINGWWDHYHPSTFPGVWALIAAEMAAGRMVGPREVFRELAQKDDDLHAWAREIQQLFRDPSQEVQEAVGSIYAEFPRPGTRDGADPFVIAEARVTGFAVVTYEGRSFSGPLTARAMTKMPGICARFEVRCIPLPEALRELGARF